MAHDHLLNGSCHCGRFRYIVEIPPDSATLAEVFFDNSSSRRRSQAALLTAWLRVPLPWYHSTTFPHYPDETHASIRRSYTDPPSTASVAELRHFCGYCGTHVSSWNEATREQADHIELTLGSLEEEDMAVLEQLGLLPSTPDGEEEEGQLLVGGGDVRMLTTTTTMTTSRPGEDVARRRGLPWFEEMVEDSRLGRVRRTAGGHGARDGSYAYEWEVLEIGGEGGSGTASTTGKRKLDDVEGGGNNAAQNIEL